MDELYNIDSKWLVVCETTEIYERVHQRFCDREVILLKGSIDSIIWNCENIHKEPFVYIGYHPLGLTKDYIKEIIV